MRKILALIALVGALAMLARTDWLHLVKIVGTADDEYYRLKSVPLKHIDSISFSRSYAVDSLSYDIMKVYLIDGDSIIVPMDEINDYVLGTNVPTVTITTDSFVNEISSKTEYLAGTFGISTYGQAEDLDSVPVNIRGRGNTSWLEPKKPYRLKFDKKISLCGLKKAKSYVLIANYIDGTLMKNAIAFELARLLGMPFTNHSVPVNVVLNGEYKGAYMLSEKIGINSASVDIDEQTGIMWELDKSYDEDYRFYSNYLRLPVMLADPDPSDLELPDSVSADDWFAAWKNDFLKMEKSVYTGNYSQTVDTAQVVDYVLVHLVCGNRELNHPKSVKLYKEHIDSLYKFGPVWDFDWGFDYINSPDLQLLIPGYSDLSGANLFYRIVRTDKFRAAFERRWDYFKTEIYPELLNYIYEYREVIRVSAYQNGGRWSADGPEHTRYSSERYDANVDKLLQWLDDRIRAIDGDSLRLLHK